MADGANGMIFEILDKNFQSVSIVDTYESAIWSDRYGGFGDFELYVPADSEVLAKYPIDYYLRYSGSRHLMVIEKVELKTDAEDGDHFIITGRSMESFLYRRVIWKQTDIDGNLQDGVERLLNENLIKPSDGARKVAGITFQKSNDPMVTKWNSDHQFTGDSLYDAIHTMCSEHDIGFELIPDVDKSGDAIFRLYYGVNRSYDQVDHPYISFSPGEDNLVSSDYIRDYTDKANFAYIGGEGEGDQRRFQTVKLKDEDSNKWNRREIFVDARGISSKNGDQEIPADQYNAKLVTEGKKKLKENNKLETFDAEVSPAKNNVYGVDYDIGDIVSFEDKYGILAKARITEYVRNQDKNGYREYPTLKALDGGGLLDSNYKEIQDSDGENINDGVIL